MRSIRIPAKVAREIRDMVGRIYNEGREIGDTECARIFEVLAPLKPKKFVVAAHKRRTQKKATKKEATAEIREAVFDRAKGLCEMCEAPATDLEHVFGRVRVPQKVSNCLALCRWCHIERTNSRPSAKHWWGRYALHFERHGYGLEQRMAAAKYNRGAE